MSGTISFNPYATSTPANPFLLQTQGYISGFAVDEPSSRLWLAGGVLAYTETLPMWGGVPITESVNTQVPQNLGSHIFPTAATGSELLGPVVARAVSGGTGVTGFSVFNQAAHMVITPGANSVPLASAYNSVLFYRVGTNAVRIVVPFNPSSVSGLSSDPINISAGLLFDYSSNKMWVDVGTAGANQVQLPTTVRLISVNNNSKVVQWNGTTASWASGQPAAVILI